MRRDLTQPKACRGVRRQGCAPASQPLAPHSRGLVELVELVLLRSLTINQSYLPDLSVSIVLRNSLRKCPHHNNIRQTPSSPS